MKRTLLIAIVVVGWVGGAALTPAAGATTESAVATESAVETASIVGTASTAGDSAATASDAPAQANETELPPGLSEDGVTDPFALVEAHRATLADDSYTISTAFAYRALNGTVFGQGTTTTRVAPGGEPYYAITSQTNENASETFGTEVYNFEVWANETGAAIARNGPERGSTYELRDQPDAVSSPEGQWEMLYSAFATTNTTLVGEVERDGTTLYKVVSTEPTDEAVAGETYDYTALVDADGVVREFRSTRHTSADDRPATFTTAFQITEIGTTAVERPTWYDRAVENGTELSGS